MATTTNFGWETPDDTDLVKDGALAIRTLGSAIDTSLVDLKGGTTGQVLSKTSNTDMDFTWVTSDDANAIQNAIVDAKGDLIAASAADTPARLAVGNNGETLVADSSTSTGLRWQATQSTQNYIINGGADFWQRGTSAAATLNYLCDRFQFNRSGGVGGSTVSRSTDAPTGFQYSIKNQRDSGNTQTNSLDGYYAIETSQSIPLAGKTVVLSFYAKKGANYSGGDLSVTLSSGTGTDQPYYSFTSLTTVSNTLVPNATLNTSWTRYYVTGTVSSSATQVGFKTSWTPTGTAGADDSVYMTGFQLEVGSVPTTFCRAGGTLAGELAACQRYYYLHASGINKPVSMGAAYSATRVDGHIKFPVTMRIAPTLVQTTGSAYLSFLSSASDDFNDITGFSVSSTEAVNWYTNTNVTTTAGVAGTVYTNNASSSIAFNSEL